MTDDLVSRLRAAIEAKVAKARAALPGAWSVRDDYEIVTSAQVPDKLVVAIGDSGGGVYDVRTAEHIIDNDPATVLAMCTAHQEIVADCAEALRQSNAPEVYLLADLVLTRLARGYDLATEQAT